MSHEFANLGENLFTANLFVYHLNKNLDNLLDAMTQIEA